MSGVALDLRHVGYSYPTAQGGREVLRDLNLRVGSGEIVAFVGRSGCGKTTLLNLASGLLAATAGELSFSAPPRAGYVFQDARLLPWLTLDENLRLVCPPDYHKDIPLALAGVGLGGRGADRPGQLSLGMAQRAAVARALVIRPDLLLLDEPSGALDELTAGELRGELADLLQRRPATTLLVTHNPAEAVLLADRVIVLGGRPARITGTLPVHLPRPRDPDDPALLPLIRALRALLGTGPGSLIPAEARA